MNEQDTAIREFLVESYENLDQLERDLVTIEDDPANRETLDRIFRTVHSVKGACGFLAYPKLEAVAHAGEGLLCRLRDGAIEWKPTITSALLSLADAMRKILSQIEASGAEGVEEYASLIGRLIDLQAEQAQPCAAPEKPPSASSEHQVDIKKREGNQAATPTVTAVCPPPEPQPVPPVDDGENERDKLLADQSHPDTSGNVGTFGDERVAARRRDDLSAGNIRVDVGLLDKLMNLVGELVLARNQIIQHANSREDAGLLGTSQRLNLITTELQEGVMKTRMQPIGNVWNKFPRIVRDLALVCGKQVRVDLEGSETELDRTIIEAIKDPLTHLVRNSVDHGIEIPAERLRRGKPAPGYLRLRAFHESGQVNIEISDDGGGIDVQRITNHALERGLISREQAARMGDHDLIQLIFRPGFSTAERITNISGRGVGMDVVKTNIEKIGGTIDVQSRQGQGTTVKIKIPLTLAIIPALIVTSSNDRFAIPQVNLLELVRLEGEQARQGIEMIHGAPIYRLRGSLLPLVGLERMLSPSTSAANGHYHHAYRAADVNFGALRDMHLRWKTRLARMLDGHEDIDLEQVVAPDKCELGRWLFSKGVQHFGGRTQFDNLVNVHADIHSAVREVVECHHSGKTPESQAAMGRVTKLSIEVVTALAALERLVEESDAVNIVVLQADGQRFGLIVEGINDTEEIVVKPLGKQLKTTSLFAGATIMGDGHVCLILDVAGIAQHSGVVSSMAERLTLEEAAQEQGQKDERSAFLLLRHGSQGRVAVPLSLVARLEEIPCSAIECSADREVVQYRSQIIPLVRLSQALGHGRHGKAEDRDPMQVVVYSQQGQSVGLVVDEILDIVEDTIQVRKSRAGRGLIGSAVIQQRVTDVIDVPGLIRTVDPELMASAVGQGD